MEGNKAGILNPILNSRCRHPYQGDRDSTLTHRSYFAEGSPAPQGRSLLPPRAEEPQKKPGGEMFSLASFLPLLPSPALIVFHCRKTLQSICRHSGTQQEGCDKGLCEGALVLPLLSSIPCHNNPTMLGLLLSCSTMTLPKISIHQRCGHHYKQSTTQDSTERKMPLKGVLGLYTHIYLYIYIYHLPCLQGVGRLWLDGGGDLIQLWILMNPLLYDGRESRKLWTWPKSCKNVSDAAAEDC